MAIIFDAHAHYDDDKFNDDREKVLVSMPENGVGCIVNAAVDLATSQWALDYSKKYDFMYATVGIHPEVANDLPDDYIDTLRKLAGDKKAVAIGEIGLDYYWDSVPRDIQKKVFVEQLELAREMNLPVVIHDRDAHGDTMEILREYKPAGLLHCFSGSAEMCKEVVKLGMSISLGGVVTFKNARHSVEVAEYIPLDRLLLETDAPYLSPVPFRGKRCDSTMIKYTAMRIAEIKGISMEKLLEITTENACRLYNIKL
ncbi:MAG: TatD family hydrolase [Acutalibacteraceae bacterium]|nr:TatD family hydrolase [Acutalibacteraceae bacterium]